MRQSTVGTVLVLGAATGFGTIGIFGELAAAEGLPISTLLPVRFTLATAVVLALAGVRGWPLPATRREWGVTLGLGVVYTAMTVLYFVSLRYLTAGLATIVLYVYPAFVAALSALVLREAVTGRTVVALTCSLAGVGLVVATDVAGAGASVAAPVGVVIGLGAACCYAIYTAGSRSLVGSIAPRSLMVGALVGTTLSMSGYGIASGGLALPGGGREWAIVVGLALFGTVVPLVCFYEGVERLEASRVGVVSTAEPVVTVVLGVVLLDEPVTWGLVFGGGLVLFGVVLVQRTRGGERPPAETAAAFDGDA